MTPCHVVEIETPKKYLLNGLWFGPKKPKRVLVFIHGLTASAFSMRSVADALVDKQTAVLKFNNRGFEKIAEIKRKLGRESKWVRAGATHEIFTECADDIQGAVNFARRAGVNHIYLMGHSTGCQKAYYWASRKGVRGVKGIILLGPLSDYAIAHEHDKAGKLARSVAYAKKLVREKKQHALLPDRLGMWFPVDAQRFLSLHTPDSLEEVFPYGQSGKRPRAVHAVRLPTLVLLAGEDEHTKTPARKLAAWFEMYLQHGRVIVIPRVGHSFRGGEAVVAREIRRFIGR